MDWVKEAFGDAVGVVVREDAEIGVYLGGILGGKYVGEFLDYAVERGVGDVAAVRFEICSAELYAGVGVGDDGFLLVDV